MLNINKNKNYKKLAAPKVAPKFFCCPIFALIACFIGMNFDELKAASLPGSKRGRHYRHPPPGELR